MNLLGMTIMNIYPDQNFLIIKIYVMNTKKIFIINMDMTRLRSSFPNLDTIAQMRR